LEKVAEPRETGLSGARHVFIQIIILHFPQKIKKKM